VLDPGDDVDSILAALREYDFTVSDRLGVVQSRFTKSAKRSTSALAASGGQVKSIYHTHGHFDHILAAGKLKAAFPKARIVLHADDDVLRVSAAGAVLRSSC